MDKILEAKKEERDKLKEIYDEWKKRYEKLGSIAKMDIKDVRAYMAKHGDPDQLKEAIKV